MIRKSVLLATVIVAVLFFLTPSHAFAYPLGNFTINRYAGLRIQPNGIDVDYVVDMAEIPAMQEIVLRISSEGKAGPNPKKADTYRVNKCAEILANLSLTLDGTALPLRQTTAEVDFAAGSAGLWTLRLTCRYQSDLTPGISSSVQFRDGNFLDHLGWREIVVQGDGIQVQGSDAPSESISDRLMNYPNSPTSIPNQTEANFKLESVALNGGTTPTPTASRLLGWSPSPLPAIISPTRLDRVTDPFTVLITANDLSASVILLSLLLAIGLGALHAVSPGHGKTMMAAYLVGVRGTPRQAVLLGLTVTVTHTMGVLILGLLVLFASRYVVPENLYPWLGILSGLIVIGMGIALSVNGWREFQHRQHHSHSELVSHQHGAFGHEHSHLPDHSDRNLSWENLVGLGLAGGLVPSTSALILLLGAVSLHRIPFGIVLIIAFGFGMAFVLVGIGMLLVRARKLIERSPVSVRWLGWLPFASAVVVIVAGIVMTAEAMLQM